MDDKTKFSIALSTERVRRYTDRVAYFKYIPEKIKKVPIDTFYDLLNFAYEANTLEDVQQLCFELSELYKYEHVTFAYFFPRKDLEQQHNFECHHITYCQSNWLNFYERNLLYRDPFTNHNLLGITPAFMQVEPYVKDHPEAKEYAMISALREYKVKNVVTLSSNAAFGKLGILRLMSLENTHSNKSMIENIADFQLISNFIMNVVIKHFKEPPLARNKEPISLTKKEKKILGLIAQGKKNAAISEELNISINTTLTHLKNIYRKLEVNSRQMAVAKATRLEIQFMA